MASIVYLQPDGVRRTVQVATGLSVMVGAIQGNVRGIEAECGGSLSCATCHVYVDPAQLDRLSAIEPAEDELLSGVAAERRTNSRLSCQIIVGPELEGLMVHIPDRQF